MKFEHLLIYLQINFIKMNFYYIFAVFNVLNYKSEIL